MTVCRLVARLFRSVVAVGGREGLDVTDYVRHVEREFGITLAAADVEHLRTLSDMVDCVVRHRRQLGLTSVESQVWPAVRQITADEMGVDVSELQPDTRYVEDLCC